MLINSPNISGSLTVTGNSVISGSLNVLGSITGAITGSATTASYVEYNNVANKPALVSGSSQVSFNGITDKPTLVSGSSQISYSGLTGIPSGIVSGSSQVSFNGIVDKPTLISGSSQVTYSGLSGIPSGIVSGSAQIASFGIFATTGSNGFNGSQSITGSLTVTGQVVAQTLNVQQVTSSIVYSSGSNIFGNSLANTQQLTGSVGVTGSLTVTTSGTELQVTNTGVNLGNALTDSHIISGSITINPSGLFVSGSGNVGIGTTSPAQKLQINGPLALGNLAEDFTTNQEYAYPIVYAGNLSGLGNGELVIQPRTTATRSIRFVTRTSGAVSSTNPDTRMIIRWDGNVGIGTTSPSWLLEVYKDTNATAAGQYPAISVNNPNASGYSAYYFYSGSTNKGGIEYSNSTNDFMFFGNSSERMRITANGNVGIGNTSPQGLLQIGANALSNNSDASNAFNLKQTSTTAATGIYLERSGERRGYYMYMGGSLDSLTFQRNNVGTKADVMSLTRDGNVGIGTDSPSAKLNTNLSVEGALLAYLVNTSATFNAGANIAVTHNSSTLGTNTAAGILLANNNNSNNAISPLIAFSAKSESTSYNHTYAAIYGQKRASGADANWNTGDLIIATGNATGPVERLRVLAAGGLTFNGDSAAANALNDYEEGSFTPSSLGTNFSSISVVFGRYIKIGNQVTIHCRWTVTPGSTGMKYVAFDLPFAFVNNSNVGFTGAVSNYNEGQTAGSSNVGTTVRNSSGSTTQQYVEAYYTSANANSSLFLSMTYFTFF